ncbi:putative carboxylesterase [Aspergillus lucknowensis]|uniref:Carboxylic ester hydrolase n=1 Tax=Aspergillus lucknowensis TaxID=176173 RepID=A0ABR4LA20_9EURO
MIGLLFLLLLVPRYGAVPGARPLPVVDLGYARYKGNRVAAGVDEYLGMRYAAPPLGDLRFRGPREPSSTSALQDASQFGPICVGVGQSLSRYVSEDCLFINIFTPSHATALSKLPVWVHIQGGGYATNANANFNGTNVVQRAGYDIVFVNFNYRVGALGFLASEQIRRDGDLNVGLLDQRKALLWVQENIEQFGGNREHVVIHGDSSGSGSIAHHMTAYGGRNDGLFVGAIHESTFWPTLRTVTEMEFQFDRIALATGCSAIPFQLSCLRRVDINRLQAANTPSPFPGGSAHPPPRRYFLPVIDHDMIRGQLYDHFDQGPIVEVPLLVGDDTNEGSIFVSNASTAEDISLFFKANYPNLLPDSINKIHHTYPRLPPLPNHGPYFPSLSAAYGDAAFTCQGNHISSTLASRFSPRKAWNYRYNVQAPELVNQGLGVPHVFELSAIFGVGFAGDSETTGYTDINEDIVPVVMDYWVSFIKTLDPNSGRDNQAPVWEPWGPGLGQRLKIQTNATEMETVPSSLAAHCSMWKSLANEMDV